MFTWAAPLVKFKESELSKLRADVQFAFLGPTPCDTPQVTVFALLGHEHDPRCAMAIRALSAAVKLATSMPRWLEHLDLTISGQKGPTLLPAAASHLERLHWRASADGHCITRRDVYGVMRTFHLGWDGLDVLRHWIFDAQRAQDLAQCSRVNRSLHRVGTNGLAQGADLPGPPAGAWCYMEGHRALLDTAGSWHEIKAALATGCSFWHTLGRTRMADDDARKRCLCGLAFPSRPHLVWQCQALRHCRAVVPMPVDRCQERLFAVALREAPAPRANLDWDDLCEHLEASLAQAFTKDCVAVATDGSAKLGTATFAIVLPEICSWFSCLLACEEQTPFRAEVEAIRLFVQRAVRRF